MPNGPAAKPRYMYIYRTHQAAKQPTHIHRHHITHAAELYAELYTLEYKLVHHSPRRVRKEHRRRGTRNAADRYTHTLSHTENMYRVFN